MWAILCLVPDRLARHSLWVITNVVLQHDGSRPDICPMYTYA